MTDVNPEVIENFNRLAADRLELATEIERTKQRFTERQRELKTEYTARLQALSEQVDELDSQIWQLLDQSADHVLPKGKKSFVTMVASFQLRQVPARITLDTTAIMEQARKLRVVRHIAVPPKTPAWKFNRDKFFAWLRINGEMRLFFDEFIEDGVASESLTIRPNSSFTVQYDNQRLTPPSTTIHRH